MNDHKLKLLQEMHDHVRKALSIAMTEFDIKESNEIQRATGVSIQDALIPSNKAMLKVLASYKLTTLQEEKVLNKMYEDNESLESIDKYQEEMDREIEQRRRIKI
ncbi:hypothetical protein [Bacillus velezensis]|uniref:hypothetical protein n=1 Tax=Bacillus velezensis TaxID=492670 RepID=UPI0011A49923|nr:hypothetical protein [Bacillus velezensis]